MNILRFCIIAKQKRTPIRDPEIPSSFTTIRLKQRLNKEYSVDIQNYPCYDDRNLDRPLNEELSVLLEKTGEIIDVNLSYLPKYPIEIQALI